MILRSLILVFCLSCVTATYAAGDKSSTPSADHPPHDHPSHDHLKKLDEGMRNSRKKKQTP